MHGHIGNTIVTYEALHHRRSIRLRDYYYTQAGAYFVTICVVERTPLFGEITDGVVNMNGYGEAVTEAWHAIPAHFPHVEVDAFVVMPNHVHGILIIDVGARHAVPLRESFGRPTMASLPTIVRSYKSAATKGINVIRGTPGAPVWQRNYYEHVIRDDRDLDRIRRYITDNPARWAEDDLNPANVTGTPGIVGAQHAAPLHLPRTRGTV